MIQDDLRYAICSYINTRLKSSSTPIHIADIVDTAFPTIHSEDYGHEFFSYRDAVRKELYLMARINIIQIDQHGYIGYLTV